MANKLFAQRRIGLYEKALPAELDFGRRMEMARELGFEYWEISIDESDERLKRLHWTREQRDALRKRSWALDFPIHSMCLSGHRKYPFGSKDPEIRRRAAEIMEQGIELAYDLGVRIIQLAGYDVYYENADEQTHELFLQGLQQACHMACQAGVILALEIMDTPYLNSILKYMEIKRQIPSPFLAVYPDLGNLFAWNNNIRQNLQAGIHEIVAIHLKDTLRVRPGFRGQFRDLAIGQGEVDFAHYFAILKELNYSGPFVIEVWAKQSHDQSVKDLQQSLAYIHNAMNQAAYRNG